MSESTNRMCICAACRGNIRIVTVNMTDEEITQLSPDGMAALLSLACARLGMFDGLTSLSVAARVATTLSQVRIECGARGEAINVGYRERMGRQLVIVIRVIFGMLCWHAPVYSSRVTHRRCLQSASVTAHIPKMQSGGCRLCFGLEQNSGATSSVPVMLPQPARKTPRSRG